MTRLAVVAFTVCTALAAAACNLVVGDFSVGDAGVDASADHSAAGSSSGGRDTGSGTGDSQGEVGDAGLGDADGSLPPKVGDPCPTPGEAFCPTFTAEALCTGGIYQAFACEGPSGCYLEAGSFHCDETLAVLGEPCRPVTNHSCSTDHKSELQCNGNDASAIGTWGFQRACPDAGCSISANQVFCN